MFATSVPAMPQSQESPAPGQKTRQVWTPEEDRLLSEAVAKETSKQGPVSWHKVASHLPGRSNKDCRKRWHYSIANTIRKGTWMREEDERLREAVELYGARWSKIAEAVGTRNGDQCWKRWYDCLDPRIDKSPWTAEEDAKLLALVSQTGRNWSDIVHQHFPNRTSLAAKNRYSILRRKQEGLSSRSSSVRRAKSKVNSASSTPTLSPSPYLGVPMNPSTSALSTPEPEFASDDWMALTEAEIDELLYQSAHLSVGDGWYASEAGTSASPSPQIGCDLDAGAGDWNASGSTQQAWMQPHAGFDSALIDPLMQATSAAGYDGCYTQGQQAEVVGFGYGTMGMYQSGAQAVPHQGLYDTSGGLISQPGMGQWPGGYNTGTSGSW